MSISKTAVTATATLATLLVLSSCGTSSTPSGTPASATAKAADLVSDGTFSFSVADDPGGLNPAIGSRTVAVNLFRFLYDPLVRRDAAGKVVSGLASSWNVDGNVVSFKIRNGVTCSDGTPVTASTVAAEFNYIKDPANASTLIGIALPNNKFSATADDASSTFTLTLDQPYLFILPALEFLPIPCGAAGADPASLTSTASGSGPYTLTEAVPNDHYTLTRRQGYTWGPAGATTAEKGMPAKIVMRIVSSETTAANLLSTGQLNAAAINGPDRKRLTATGLTATQYTSGGALMLFNEQAGRPTADPSVRKAIVEALDRDQIAQVLTQGLVTTATHSLAPASPQPCPDPGAADAIPKTNVNDATSLLASAGWTAGPDGVLQKGGTALTLNAPYLSTYEGNKPAAELMSQQLAKVGIKMNLTPVTQGTLSTTVFKTGDYDIWPTLAYSIPFQSGVYGLLGGPPPPAGTNAGHVSNPTFTSLAQQGNQTTGSAGCKLWVQAESALFSNADAESSGPVITNWITGKATFSAMQGRIIPTSIRLTK